MNTSSKYLRNKIPSTLSTFQRVYSKFSFIQTKNFMTINKQFKNNSNLTSGNTNKTSSNLLKGLTRNNYCEKIGDLIMLNSKNEIKITFEEKTFSIFFNETDSINVVNEKIQGISEKIQSVEFLQCDSKENLTEDFKNKTLMKDFIKNPFAVRINKHLSMNYIPGVFPQLFIESNLINEIQSNNPDFLKTSEDIKNVILLSLYDLKQKNSADLKKYEEEKACFIADILSKLDQREKFLKSLFEKQSLSEKMVNEKLEFMSKVAVKLGMLFAISHFSVFYALIYKFYAWDVIEPITYIVGNIYWIATLGFLAFNNRKLEFEMLQYDSIKKIYFSKYAKQLNYNEHEKLRLQEELKTIELLRSGLIDI